jgi:hypothetical protein
MHGHGVSSLIACISVIPVEGVHTVTVLVYYLSCAYPWCMLPQMWNVLQLVLTTTAGQLPRSA